MPPPKGSTRSAFAPTYLGNVVTLDSLNVLVHRQVPGERYSKILHPTLVFRANKLPRKSYHIVESLFHHLGPPGHTTSVSWQFEQHIRRLRGDLRSISSLRRIYLGGN